MIVDHSTKTLGPIIIAARAAALYSMHMTSLTINVRRTFRFLRFLPPSTPRTKMSARKRYQNVNPYWSPLLKHNSWRNFERALFIYHEVGATARPHERFPMSASLLRWVFLRLLKYVHRFFRRIVCEAVLSKLGTSFIAL